jgi:hypothetical protein
VGRRRGIIWGTLVVVLLGGGFLLGRRALWNDPKPDRVVIGDCSHELDPEAAAFAERAGDDPGEMTYEMHLKQSAWGDGPGFFTWGPISQSAGFLVRQGGTSGAVSVTVASADRTARIVTFCDGEWVRTVHATSDQPMDVELRDPTGGATISAGHKARLPAHRR